MWALMVAPSGKILRVRECYADEKLPHGWTMVARESELLPWPTPSFIPQSNPVRRVEKKGDGEC